MEGRRWELNTLDAPTSTAVRDNVTKAVRKQSTRVIIDGRKAGLTEAEFNRGIGRAIGLQEGPSEYIVLFPDGLIKRWP